MKKEIIILVVLLMIVLIIGGIAIVNRNSDSVETANNSTEEAFIFEVNGQEIKMGENFLTLNLPEANSEYEAESCAFNGIEKTYSYDSYEIATYPEDSNEKILTIYLLDDEVATKEGIKIGDTLDDMKQAYGENCEISDISYIYTKGNSTLTFIINGEIISSIEYRLITE